MLCCAAAYAQQTPKLPPPDALEGVGHRDIAFSEIMHPRAGASAVY